MQRFTLNLGDYPVRFSLGRGLEQEIVNWIRSSGADKVIVVTDETVHRLHARGLIPLIEEHLPALVLTVAPGDAAKTFPTLGVLLEQAAEYGITKRTLVVSFGGGAVSNIAGMVAGLLFRGLQLIHIPTTLLAQVDAAISRKQAVNSARGKNLFGLWLAPAAIFVDMDYLETLDRSEVRNGLAEIIKLSLITDLAYFERLSNLTLQQILDDRALLEEAVDRGIRMTCRVLGRDPDEGTSGLSLEIGHTIGHAIEILKGGNIAHGEAISMGMVIEAELSVHCGLLERIWPTQIAQVLNRFELPTTPPTDLSSAAIISALRYDNKRTTEAPCFVPIRDLGRMDLRPRDQQEAFIDETSLARIIDSLLASKPLEAPVASSRRAALVGTELR